MQRAFAGKSVFILSHEMTVTGAPRVCTELAHMLLKAGARVSLATPPPCHPATLPPCHPALSDMTPPEMERQVSALVPDTEGLDMLTNAPIKVASQADLVIVSTVVPWQAAWLRKFRAAYPSYPALVWWVHEGPSVMSAMPDPVKDTREVVKILCAQQPRIVDAVIFPSWATRSWWVDQITEAGHPPVFSSLPPLATVIHWGLPNWRAEKVNVSRLDKDMRAKERRRRGFTDDNFLFVVLGTFHPLKGYAGIFKAFDLARKICGPRLRLLASGRHDYLGTILTPDLDWIVKDDAVLFERATKDVPSFLAVGDAYISNTKAGGETWGLATLEALAMGLPSLVSRAGGSVEMVEHNVTALMHDIAMVSHPNHDTALEVPQLADHMCALAQNADLRKRLSMSGQRLVADRLNHEHMERALVNAFAGLLHASTGWRHSVPDKKREPTP